MYICGRPRVRPWWKGGEQLEWQPAKDNTASYYPSCHQAVGMNCHNVPYRQKYKCSILIPYVRHSTCVDSTAWFPLQDSSWPWPAIRPPAMIDHAGNCPDLIMLVCIIHQSNRNSIQHTPLDELNKHCLSLPDLMRQTHQSSSFFSTPFLPRVFFIWLFRIISQ